MDRTDRSLRDSFRQFVKRQRTSKSAKQGSVPAQPYSTVATSDTPNILYPVSKRAPDTESEEMPLSDSKKPTEAPKVPLLIRFFDPEVHSRDARGRTLDDIIEHGDDWFERCHDYVQMLFPLPEGSPFNHAAPVITRAVFEAFRARPELRAELRRAWVRMMKFYGFDIVEEGAEEAQSKEEAHCEAEAPLEPGVGVEEMSTEDVKISDDGVEGQESKKTQHGDAVQSNKMATTETPTVPDESVTETAIAAPPKPIKLVLARNYQKMFQNWVLRFDHNHLRITRVLRSLRVLGLQEECDAYFSMLVQVYEKYGRINERSLIYWKRAVERPLWIAPDDEKVHWLRVVCNEIEEAERAETQARELAEKEGRELASRHVSSKDTPVQNMASVGQVNPEITGQAAQATAMSHSESETAQKKAAEDTKDDVPTVEVDSASGATERGVGDSGTAEQGTWDKVGAPDDDKWNTIGKTNEEREKWSRLENSTPAS